MGIPGRSVWVFLGDRARWPSGVFSSRETAVEWIAEHRLTGMITEYPVDVGVYEWAVAAGAFRPGKPQHPSSGFIGGFTTAAQEHGHFTDGIGDLARHLPARGSGKAELDSHIHEGRQDADGGRRNRRARPAAQATTGR